MSSKPLTDRAKRRLRIAAGILRGSGKQKGSKPAALPLSRTNFYEDMIKFIDGLPPEERDSLKAHVDWVESFEVAAETFITTNGTNTSQHQHRPRTQSAQ
jgi:hypothetical protein